MAMRRLLGDRGMVEADRSARRWTLPACVILAIMLRLLAMLIFPVAPISDYAWYLDRARDIAAGLGYVERGVPTAYWPVGYPAILAAAIALTGSDHVAPLALNLAFAATTGWGMIMLGRQLAMPRPAIIAALLIWAVYPNSIFYAPQLASEGPYVPLLIWATYFLLARTPGAAAIAGGLLGLATLIKAQTYLYPIMLLVLLGVAKPRPGWRLVALKSVLLYAALFAVVAPWTLRNHQRLGEWVLVSTNGGPTLLNGNNALANGGYVDEADEPGILEIYDRTGIRAADRLRRQVDYDRRTKALGWQWIRENPAAFAMLMPRKLFELWGTDGEAAWAYERHHADARTPILIMRIVDQLLYMAIVLLALRRLWTIGRNGLRDRALPAEATLFAFPLFITAIALLFSGQARFHAPAMPLLIMAASMAWATRRRGRRSSSA